MVINTLSALGRMPRATIAPDTRSDPLVIQIRTTKRVINTAGRIRTYDRWIWNPMLYQAELLPYQNIGMANTLQYVFTYA